MKLMMEEDSFGGPFPPDHHNQHVQGRHRDKIKYSYYINVIDHNHRLYDITPPSVLLGWAEEGR